MTKKADRRTFLKLSTMATSLAAFDSADAKTTDAAVEIVIDPGSPLAGTQSVAWAAEELRKALTAKGIVHGNKPGTLQIVISQQGSPLAAAFQGARDLRHPETVAILVAKRTDRPSLLVTGVDARGIVYGLLELADETRFNDNPILALKTRRSVVETTPNPVRSVARAFLSEIEDKSWFYDQLFWSDYLDRLASARFNRFNFALGFGYDFPRGVTGDYLHFPYPYLVEVPGYPQVQIEPALQPEERKRNLETLQFIATETARRGVDFQLGIWTHAYEWVDSPKADHRIVGLTPQNHAPYCRDALAEILRLCPQITGLTLRIHGESGIPERSYPFWETLFEALKGAGRVLEIEMHAKGLDETMINMARHTGMPVKAGAKFWAEHQGLAYHQADIRATEYPRSNVTGTFSVSSGERNFTRYGYGDFYGQGSRIDVLYRVWPGTQRHLLWADPALAAGYGRAAHFCGAAGMELCEPLTFKGREGSGHPGGRNAYSDSALSTTNRDTQKFALTYLLWGRYLYNPDATPEFYRRVLKHLFGSSGLGLESALANSSRILPLVTTAWLPSASNHSLWVEMFTPLSLLPIEGKPLYSDSPAPHNVSAISPLDPQLFLTIDQHARNIVSGTREGKYNPAEVADWLDTFASRSNHSLKAARTETHAGSSRQYFRQIEQDLLIVNGLGFYFANLFRAALNYSLYELTRQSIFARSCLQNYRAARNAWAGITATAQEIYLPDVSYGDIFVRRGHWADRLPLIEKDLAAVEKHLQQPSPGGSDSASEKAVVPNRPSRPVIEVRHAPPQSFHRGQQISLSLQAPATVIEAVLWYRHVNQGERWRSGPMTLSDLVFQGPIPAAYTDSSFPLQYYFELKTSDAATLHPTLNSTLNNQPYFAIMQS
jgi:hypothetical protein